MGLTEFQNFIGKHIKEISVLSGDLKHNADLNKYYMFSEVGCNFYTETYHNVTITTNDQDIIKDIKIYIHEIIDKTFYDTFNDNYGLPSKIMVVDTISVPSFGRLEGNGHLGSYSMKRSISLKKGNFEDKPVLLIWNKKDFQIRIFLRYDIKISEISFRLPTDKF